MKKQKLSSAWWGVILIGECFIALNAPSTTNYGIRALPYIQFDYKILVVAIVFFVCCVTICQIARKSIKIDNIFILLVIRIILAVIPAVYIEQYYWGNILGYVIAPVVYFIIINRNIEIEDLLPYIRLFAIISTIQCVVLFISSPFPYSDVRYKAFFVSPVGASNYFASIMIITFLIIFFTANKNRTVWYFIGFFCIFFTKSRTSLFTYFLIPCMDLFVSSLKKSVTTTKHLSRVWFIGLFCFCIVLFVGRDLINKTGELVESFILGFSSSGSDITSGRIDLFLTQFYAACEFFLFGSGFSFVDSHGSMHNFLLESFYVSGLLGLILQIFILKFIYKNIKKVKSKTSWVLLAIFIIASFEKVLSTIMSEFLLWTLVGLLRNENEKTRVLGTMAGQSYRSIHNTMADPETC